MIKEGVSQVMGEDINSFVGIVGLLDASGIDAH